jgi:hypothetical protein
MAQTALEFVRSYAASFATLFNTPLSSASGPSRDGILGRDAPNHAGVVFLRPARRSGARLILLPLLPPPAPKIDLPPELWTRCLRFAVDLSAEKRKFSPQAYSRLVRCRQDLVLVNKSFRVRLFAFVCGVIRCVCIS